jgi:TolB protein
MQVAKWFLALSALLGISCLQAQVDIIASGKIGVTLVPFNGPNSEVVRKVIADNLNRTQLINASAAAGERYVISATTTANGITGRLYDANAAVDMLTKNFPGTGDLRAAAHVFADEIFEKLTGVKGFATSRVAFISSRSGHKELYVMDIDGGNPYALTDDQRISAGPSWSKDGKSIGYTSYKSGYPDVYVVKLAPQPDGKNSRTRIAFFPGTNTGPAFSPDGSKVALMLSKDGNPEIYSMPATGGTPTRLTKTRGTETSPCWSPDGSKIVYTSDERGSVQLFIMPATGGEGERLITGGTYSAEPDWSPDGTKIAFTMRVGGRLQIGVYDLMTRQVTQVTTDGGADPSWTRNSRHLVFANNGSLFVLDSVTRQFGRLDNNLTECKEPSVSP